MAGLDLFEEALLAALRTESDCVQLLRGVLDAGETPPRIIKFASRTVKHAERLLEDGRRAWRSLAALRHYGFSQSRAAWDPGYETQWPHALEEVAADLHALKATVLAIPHHQRNSDDWERPSGRETGNLRVIGYQNAGQVLKTLETAQRM